MAQATERQQEVLALIEQKKTVKEMAAAMGLTENGVRSHIKRLQQRGLVSKNWKPGSTNRARSGSGGNRRTAVATSGNGSTASGSGARTGTISLDGIPAVEEAWSQMEARRTNISEEVESIDARVKELTDEQQTLTERRDTLSVEAERLQRVEDALAGAVA